MHRRWLDVHQIVILEYPYTAAFTMSNAGVRRSQVDTVSEILTHHSTSLLLLDGDVRHPRLVTTWPCLTTAPRHKTIGATVSSMTPGPSGRFASGITSTTSTARPGS